MPINSPTLGTNYFFQGRAVGGSTGYSDWSDAVQHMSLGAHQSQNQPSQPTAANL